jgi:hypothetical protein
MKKLIPLLVLLTAACQELAVTNPNEADRVRATKEPTSVESFVSSAFRTWWEVAGHNDYPSWAFSTMSHEITSSFADFGQFETSAEPRSAWNNSPVSQRNNVNETPWYGLYGAISPVNDALIAIDSGLVIGDENRTARARAVGKFIQGISHGYLAMYFDQAFIADEHLAVDTISTPVFHPHAEVEAAAIEELDSAIAIAQRSDFTIPPESWFFVGMDQDDLARLANSFAARILAYTPRTREERAAVDWEEVIRRIDAGITSDFAPVSKPDILWDDWKRLLARTRSGPRSDFGRPSYWLIGPADSTDGYVNWLATPLSDRHAFQLETTDKRIQRPGFPDSSGTYFGYDTTESNIGSSARGTWRYSWYFYHRFGTGDSWELNTPEQDLTVTEMDLLKAEALIRLGRADEAVPLINKTRVANGGLPPVTTEGPPEEQGCVPRKMNGDCGSLWDALRYEKRIEGAGVSGITAFMDARGWQTLPVNTFVELPVPGRELATLQLPLYSFGGPGGQSSAPEPDEEACPVALPRCP